MFGLTIGGLLNSALDPVFIFALDMGVGGAALATIISQLVSFAILFVMVQKHSAARIHIRRFDARHLGKILPTGAPSFYRQGLSSLAMVLLNRAAGVHGDAAIAAMSVVSRIMGFCFSALIGFYQGFQPVCGFNWGAKRFDRVRASILFSLKVATIGLTAFAIVLIAFAPALVNLFRPGDADVNAIGSLALRLQALLLPTMGWAVINNMAHQSLGMSKQASIMALARQGLFFIPAILALPALFGLMGVQLAQPVADLLAFGLAFPFGVPLLGSLKARS
jgi:Na+-driven multidrug efflux pump